MARPKGFQLNTDAFEDLLVARGMTRSEIADQAEIALSSLSGLTRIGRQKGASLPVALRIASVMRVRPGTLFPELAGRVAAEEVA
jgi:transcriptional regulator with XRE-family HTH domain